MITIQLLLDDPKELGKALLALSMGFDEGPDTLHSHESLFPVKDSRGTVVGTMLIDLRGNESASR